jgi:hypothetical protein
MISHQTETKLSSKRRKSHKYKDWMMEGCMMTSPNDNVSYHITASFEATRRRVNAPCWVGEGWQKIVVDAVEKIEWILSKDPITLIEWREIKEWHGTLAMRYRFLSAGDDEIAVRVIADVVAAAKLRADKACVVCGAKSDGAFEYKGETLRVLCATHRAQA